MLLATQTKKRLNTFSDVKAKNGFNQLKEEEFVKFPVVVNPAILSSLTPLDGVGRLIMLDRYSYRDNQLESLKIGDTVVTIVKEDPKYPTKGYGTVTKIKDNQVTVKVEYPEDTVVTKPKRTLIKPLELFWEQISYRVAKDIASAEVTKEKENYWFNKFYWMLSEFLAIPGGRIMYGAGIDADVTLFNCFVLPFIQDSRQGIIKHIGLATEIMSRGGGVGSNISTLRPSKATVKGVNGFSSGSIPWADYLSKLTHLIIQGGSRRGAQMIGLSDWHPDIIEFILCKIQNPLLLDKIFKECNDQLIKDKAESYLVRDGDGKPIGVRDLGFMTGANISVLVSDDFMEAVENDGIWDLRFPDLDNLTKEQKEFYNEEWEKIGDVRKWAKMGLPVKVYFSIRAREMWDFINTAARFSAEPGIIFIDRYQKESNSWYYQPIVVTNPCGEQGLPAFGVCNLIAINLDKMFNPITNDVDWELLHEVTVVSQRFADNVVDRSFYFLPDNEKMAKDERREGKGVMGLADLMLKLKLAYGSEDMLKITDKIFEKISVDSYLASSDIAEEKGSFPLFDANKIIQSGFLKRMPEIVINAILTKGLRNVCSLTVAPTGTTGTMVGVSQGLEPYYGFEFFRNGSLGKLTKMIVPIAQEFFNNNPNATELPSYFVSAMMITPEEHIRVQATIQRWVDSSLSKTANAPAGFTVQQTKKLYELAYKLGCKGTTIYVDGSRDTQILTLTTEDNEINGEIKEELFSDTLVCHRYLDENGNLIKECS
jgi:ribonucleoside-diphosphate reductase alpha chain